MKIRKQRLNESSRVYNGRFNRRLNESLYDIEDESDYKSYFNDPYYVQIERDLNRFGYTMGDTYFFFVYTPADLVMEDSDYFELDRQEMEQVAKDAKWEDFDRIGVYSEGEIRPIEDNSRFRFIVSMNGMFIDKDKYQRELFRNPDPDMFEDFAESLRNAQSAQKVLDNIDWLKFPVYIRYDTFEPKDELVVHKALASYMETEKRRYNRK